MPLSVVASAGLPTDRMAATIAPAASLELARRGKSGEWSASELGMDPDQVLRLKQTQGLAELFADQEFSEAHGDADPWEHPDSNAV
ncbi:hypothetical protein ACFXPQ_02480 [Streptomyces lydicus]|uniref:hypothetical protein n=1 Tax=Streptomyces lydicus TaxID=47763 RepID=UPI00369E91F0